MVRREVFVQEQGFPSDSEPDALDEWSWQVVLYDGDAPIATGRIYLDEDDFFLGRICVLRAMRGQGMGDALMRLLIDKALSHGADSLVLSAQEQAMPFYARYGFEPEGESYDDDGVPHRRMRATADAMKSLFVSCKGNCGGCGKC